MKEVWWEMILRDGEDKVRFIVREMGERFTSVAEFETGAEAKAFADKHNEQEMRRKAGKRP